ncbi:MAG: rhodanese-like domain-containing protein [Candidatus Contendobacter sp.]|nr:rhodanese-like domain-containing protein [Candidatus Contendobacter sp.]
MHKQAWFWAVLLFSTPALADHGGPAVPGQPLVIDVRTVGEYRQAHVREAVNIPFDEIAGRITVFAPERDVRIVLYCRSGRRSGIAEQTLRQMGYRRIENRGGLDDMLRGGYRTD